MSSKVSGQCTCGAVSYTCSSEPKFTLICQCRQCQRITGTGHAAQFAVPANDTTLKGTTKQFTLTADSGNAVDSAFCEICGNPMFKTTAMMPDLLFFHAATLDDPSVFKPQMVVHSASSQPWDYVDPDIERR